MRRMFVFALCALAMAVTQIKAAEPVQRTFNNPKVAAKQRLHFSYISKVMGAQYWAIVEMGVRKAAEELGIDVTYTGLQNEAEVEKQSMLLQDALSSKADAIIIAPTDSRAMVNPIQEAYATGVPIVLVDTRIFSDAYDTCLQTNNYNAGAICAEMMLKAAKGDKKANLKVAVQVATLGSQTMMDRVGGFKDYWAKNAPKGWEVLWDEIKISDADFQKALNNSQDILMRYPDIPMFWAPNNSGVLATATALKELNKKDVCLIGMDFAVDTELLMRQGFITGVAVQMQYQMGYKGVYAAYNLLNNKPVERNVDTGVFPVTVDNIDTPEAEKVMYPAGRPASMKK